MERITWECFLREIQMIQKLSDQLNDNWQIIVGNDDVGGTYLAKTNSIALNIGDSFDKSNGNGIEWDELKVEDNERHLYELTNDTSPEHSHQQLIRFEYHVLYHISYAMPYLCFNAYKSNGSLLTLDDAWSVFKDHEPNHANAAKQNLYDILTQMEHPVLFKPFLTLHPCRIADVLATLPNSQNKVLSFLSIYGPTVYLSFNFKYANCLSQMENKENR